MANPASVPGHGHRPHRRPHFIARLLAWAVVIPVLWCAVGVILAPWVWVGALAIPWAGHAALALVVPMVVWRRYLLVGVGLVALLLLLLVPRLASAWSVRAEPPRSDDIILTVASANIFKENPLRAGDISTITELAVDCLLLIEIDQGDEDSLRDDPRWPYQRWEHGAHGDHRGLGLALLSRYPLREVILHRVGSDVLIAAQLQPPGAETVQLFAIHTKSPVSAGDTALRNRQIEFISRQARASTMPVIALGDWNCTPDSLAWANLQPSGLLRPPGHAPATWPSWLGPLGIPIDHILVRGTRISDFRSQALPGSDHRLVAATVGISARGAAPARE